MKITYSHLQSYFDTPLPSVDDVAHTFTFGAFEIESVDAVTKSDGTNDWVIDVKVLPNRAHDCLSWIGIAREYAALSGRAMKHDAFLDAMPDMPTVGKGARLAVSIEDTQYAPVHTLALVTGVHVAPSPSWLREALEVVGQRSINNVVDVTNYVLLEYGQPTHAFDAGKFATDGDVRGIRVRAARDGESLTILGGKEYTLQSPMQVLTDMASDVVLDIAGIKGGTHAELTDATTEVIVTSGKYDPVTLRKTGQTLGLRTDAAKRFENEIPDILPYYGLQRVVALLHEVCGGMCVETVTAHRDTYVPVPVTVACERIRATLGTPVADETISNILASLVLSPVVANGNVTVTPPWWRLDIALGEDVIEEVGRVVGYETITPTPLPKGRTVAHTETLLCAADRVREVARAEGCIELSTYSLHDHGAVSLANALAADKGWLRENLREGILQALAANEYNAPAVGVYECLKVFEIGRVFTMEQGVRVERTHVGVGVRYLSGKKRAERTNATLLLIKSAIETALGVHVDHHIDSETLEFDLEGAIVGKEYEVQALPMVPPLRYVPLSPYPTALRDVAVWDTAEASHTAEEKIRACIREHAGPLLMRADVFDTFSKEGKTSYAFHLVFQSYEKTLGDAELLPVMNDVYAALHAAGYTIR